MLGICNSRKFGTKIPLNITENPMDGKFEIVIIEKMDASSLLKAGLSKYDERFVDNQNIKVIATKKAETSF